ncbi:MAG: acyltransferase [Actinomycetia bacterium]|nr:acyltransferase [Actinomycetes bacterium]
MTEPTTTRRELEPSRGSHAQASAADLAGAARPDRNRAVDAYRAVAMLAVAIGHWAAAAVSIGVDGSIEAGNALEFAPSMSWITWLFQVMPLFFVVGGFASAMSLDAHNSRSGDPAEWIAARLRRMLAPAIGLATVWLAALLLAVPAGFGVMAGLAATAAAIPLWFLANYTIDTALAPFMLPRFRKHPIGLPTLLIGVFVAVEIARYSGVPLVPQINWVLGWLLFQTMGFAWRDGLLPSARPMLAIAAGAWGATVALVALGPWPVAMVHFPGLTFSPTHPPSIALVMFGLAYSATALAAAPTVTRWLAGDGAGRKVWVAVVAGNGVAMSVYLWHMTAAILAGLVAWPLGLLPTADVGTGAWWLQKLPLMAVSTVILAGLVAAFSRIERQSLLGGQHPWRHGLGSTLAIAAVVSTALKLWASGSPALVFTATALLVAMWHLLISPNSVAERIGRFAKEDR